MAIQADELGNEIAKYLKIYTKEVEQTLEEVKEEITEEGVQELRATSPKKTGKYGKGWRKKKTRAGYIIYNGTPHYRLTHLLEKGYAKRGGGRVAARPHIQPVEAMLVEKFYQAVERAIKR